MRYALVGMMLAASIGTASAQDVPEITVRPLDDGLGGTAYVGPYGRNLPGVLMYSGRALPVTPDTQTGGVPYDSLQKIPSEYTYQSRPLPILDSWHGTLGGGFPF
ncbi:MAG: hypothetical protein AAGB11_02500 [Pseudomonadota bacterium]